MQKDIENKAMQSEEAETKQAFRFTGDSSHPPIVIEAPTQAEAIELYNEYLNT
jgi:hypothetical protein